MPDAETLIKLSQTLEYSFEQVGAVHSGMEAPGEKQADAEQPVPAPSALDHQANEAKNARRKK